MRVSSIGRKGDNMALVHEKAFVGVLLLDLPPNALREAVSRIGIYGKDLKYVRFSFPRFALLLLQGAYHLEVRHLY